MSGYFYSFSLSIFGRFSLLFLRLPLTGWCAQCTLTLSDIGNALLSCSTRFPSNALFHLSFWNAKQTSFLPFLWFLSYGYCYWVYYILPPPPICWTSPEIHFQYQSFRVSDVETPIYQSKHYIRLNLATNMNYFAKLVDYFVAKVVLKPLKLCVYTSII